MSTNIRFPNLGIELTNVGTGINVFGIDIAFYGMVIAIGMLCGYLIASYVAKKTGQNPDLYLDFAIWAIVISVICARIYYVVFAWDEFSENPFSILNLRTGGLAIYGGVIGAVGTAIVYSKIHKVNFRLLADTGVIGLLLGQVIGRWGNFFNREAFGKYTNGLFAMQVDIRNVSSDYRCSLEQLTARYTNSSATLENIKEIREHSVLLDGATYIQVHPTFLYESLWNLVLMILLLLYTKHKKYNGEVFLLYLFGYGLGRVWIEGLRTDQLFLWNSGIPVSQLLSLLLVVGSGILLIYNRHRYHKNQNNKYGKM